MATPKKETVKKETVKKQAPKRRTPRKSQGFQLKLTDKLDFKTIIILVLLLMSTIFGLMWFFGGNDASKQKVKELEAEFKKLEKDKEAADVKIAQWQTKYKEADAKDAELEIQVAKLKSDYKIAEQKANKSKIELDKVQGGISENRKEIEHLKKNPPTLSDEQLLEALIKKMN